MRHVLCFYLQAETAVGAQLELVGLNERQGGTWTALSQTGSLPDLASGRHNCGQQNTVKRGLAARCCALLRRCRASLREEEGGGHGGHALGHGDAARLAGAGARPERT